MGIFKLLPKTGEHEERDASGAAFTYKAGDVLESDKNLVTLFPNKFLRVDTEVALGGGVPQPAIPVPHRFIKDDVLVEPTDGVGDAKPGETGDAKPSETGDAKPGEKVAGKDFV